ncbi:MAG: glutamate--tRNA ligase [Candidatus Pacebacteria bacterium]|nr:glutamate--tRNA ligase [Candidatus Paceibacterota bacterium]
MFSLFNKNKVRTRFAPSPTGELHIGGARTAFFAYIFAKQNKGDFFLRIEDTDRERYVEGSVERIIDSLKWLGIIPDNLKNLMVQSDRLDIYKKAAFDLVDQGDAYICTCSGEELAEDRERLSKEGKPPRYLGYCRNKNLKLEDVKNDKYVIRMKMPEKGNLAFEDMIRGNVEFDLSLLDDQVLLKSDGYPTYHLASIIDDHDMKISHVIRAEEWLSSTPKHILLYQMFKWKMPKFAHLPMILSPDGGKLSKRHGATGIFEFKKIGYLPEALVNFIALLGWHPKEDKEAEIMSIEEIIKEFELKRVQKAGAIFNTEKLDWMNAQYIKKLDNDKLREMLEDIFGDEIPKEKITDKILEMSKDRMSKLSEFKQVNDFVFEIPDYKKDLLIWKKGSIDSAKNNLKIIKENIENISENNFSKENLEKALMPVADQLGRGEALWPLRVSLSGKDKSPGPFELLEILGKKESLSRINAAIKK